MTRAWIAAYSEFAFVYAVFFVFEWAFKSSRPVVQIPHWWPRVAFLAFLRIAVGILLGSVFIYAFQNAPVFLNIRRWSQELPPWLPLIAAFFTYTFLQYWWHRLRHKNELSWRVFHQMHHAPKRFDLSLTVYVHPLDVATLVFVMSLSLAICGVEMRNLSLLAFVASLLDKPQHMHIRTPRWLGYFIFRPEQHSLHHATHDVNYGLIPLWDLVFGTFQDCADEAEEIGFSESAQARFWASFFLKKIS